MKQPEFTNKFHRFIYKLNKNIGTAESVLSMITMWLLVVMVIVFILARYVFKISMPWSDEAARYLLILLGWLGAAYAASNGDHLEIDILGALVKKHSKNPEKILAITDRISKLLSMSFLGVFMFYYTRFVFKMAKIGTAAVALPFKMWIPMSFVIIGGLLIFIHTLCNLLLPREHWSDVINAENQKKGSEEK